MIKESCKMINGCNWLHIARKFKTGLEGHLDEAGAPQGKTARDILAELAQQMTTREVVKAVNIIIDPYEVNEQTIRILMARKKIRAQPAGKGKPWSKVKKRGAK